MARRKKPTNETTEQTSAREHKELVSDQATRSEKLSWDRKMDNMVSLLAKLKPLEEQMLSIAALKSPILDQITVLRKDMLKDCVHPYDQLVLLSDGVYLCKFCEKKLAPTLPK